MKPVFRVESANEEIIRGGWYLLADSLAADPDLRVRLGQEGRAYAEHWHAADRIIPDLERDYAEIMAATKQTRPEGEVA